MAVELNYNGNTLPEEITQELINYAENTLNVPPSYLITKLHYEGLWGGSAVGQSNNNWGGMTWNSSWSDPYKRASGVTITRGTPRPSVEGGYYIKYASTEDFLKDWSHLIRIGGIYNVGNSDTFDEAVKGMFVYGGAQYDYAIMGTTGSKNRYELYLQGMKARRTAINNANNGILDDFDNGNYANNEPVDVGNSDLPTVGGALSGVIGALKDQLINVENELLETIVDVFSPYAYSYGKSVKIGNSNITVTKIYDNVFKVDLTGGITNSLDDIQKDNNDKIDIIEKEENETTEKDDNSNPNPNKNNVPFFPHKKPYRMTSPYGWRIHPRTGNRRFHAGTDYAGQVPGTSYDLYATQEAKVTLSRWSNTGGYMVYLEHIGDNYHSRYLHLASTPLVNVGDIVKKGQKIGMSGNTGASEGVHLHFEVATSQEGFGTENGTIDPEKYLKMRFN